MLIVLVATCNISHWCSQMMVAILRLTTSMPSGSVFATIRALALSAARVSQWNREDCRTTIQDLRHSLRLSVFGHGKSSPLLTAGYEAIDGGPLSTRSKMILARPGARSCCRSFLIHSRDYTCVVGVSLARGMRHLPTLFVLRDEYSYGGRANRCQIGRSARRRSRRRQHDSNRPTWKFIVRNASIAPPQWQTQRRANVTSTR